MATTDPFADLSPQVARPQPQGLADVLDRVLDKGIVIAGDISIAVLDIELLTIRVRLLIASVDKAQEMGINWWQHDTRLTTKAETNFEATPKGIKGRTEETMEARPMEYREETVEVSSEKRSPGDPATPPSSRAKSKSRAEYREMSDPDAPKKSRKPPAKKKAVAKRSSKAPAKKKTTAGRRSARTRHTAASTT